MGKKQTSLEGLQNTTTMREILSLLLTNTDG